MRRSFTSEQALGDFGAYLHWCSWCSQGLSHTEASQSLIRIAARPVPYSVGCFGAVFYSSSRRSSAGKMRRSRSRMPRLRRRLARALLRTVSSFRRIRRGNRNCSNPSRNRCSRPPLGVSMRMPRSCGTLSTRFRRTCGSAKRLGFSCVWPHPSCSPIHLGRCRGSDVLSIVYPLRVNPRYG